ncbi:hypothetical protein PCK1_000270 [Pneumocystis canis]|nr:hypothetical protein PCK1_000270 [Pneumocystis canis]
MNHFVFFPIKIRRFDVENTGSLKAVQVDSLVVLKIIKHSRESFAGPVAIGQLLGLDMNGVLQITNSFPLSYGYDTENTFSVQNKITYMQQMMRCLKEIGADNNIVGWYQSSHSGTFINTNLIENQFSYHQALSDRTVVLIHGIVCANASQSPYESLSLKAFRLTPSFVAAKKEGKFNAESIGKYGLTRTNILEELPLVIHNSRLAISLLHYLDNQYKIIPTAPALSLTPLSSNFDYLEPTMQYRLSETLIEKVRMTEECIDALPGVYETETEQLTRLSQLENEFKMIHEKRRDMLKEKENLARELDHLIQVFSARRHEITLSLLHDMKH